MIKFADEAKIRVASGKGGNGCIAFRREKYVPNGGPAGGDGGRGGDVIFQIRQNMRGLTHLRAKTVYKARNGSEGMGKKRYGKKGEDVLIPIPPFCIIKDARTGRLLHDFGEAEEGEFVFLKGGKGGWGNCHFKGPQSQAPRIALKGAEGEEMEIIVELNIVADIGFVGHPNAGKSSLLNYFTRARAKVADYPFTTKFPNLGVMRLEDGSDIILLDIPGLLEGAGEGVGLGLKFLKHISRTVAIAFLIDLSSENYLISYDVLLKELASYSQEVADKKHIVIGTKLDLPDGMERLALLKQKLATRCDVIGISVLNDWGMDEVKKGFITLFNRSKKTTVATDEGNCENHFMQVQLEDVVYESRDDFGATVSLSRKRRVKK